MTKPSVFDDGAARLARRFGVSVKALRVYEAAGLLAPARTASGWRVYGKKEAERLHAVLSLKQLGLPLTRIAELFHGDGPDLAGLLEMQAQALETQRRRAQTALAVVRAAQARLAEGRSLSPDDLANLVRRTAMSKLEWTPELEALAQKSYTPEQREQLKARALSEADQARVSAAWAQIFTDIDAFPEDGDPRSPEGLEIGRRAVALIQEFTRGDKELWNSSARFWRAGLDDPETASQLSMNRSHWDFLGAAMAELNRLGELQP